MLAAIPRLPGALLARLTSRMIERLDEIDGDPDVEDCEGQDRVDDRGRICSIARSAVKAGARAALMPALPRTTRRTATAN